MQVLGLLEKAYMPLVRVGDFLQPVFLLVFRLTWGWAFFISGKGKLLNHKDIVEFFTDLGIPMPDLNAWFVGGLECVGGILLLLGLCTRPLGALLTVNMTVAYLAVKDDRETVFNVFGKDGLDNFTHADPFFFLLTALMMFVFGPGVLSLDYLFKKVVLPKIAPPAGPDINLAKES